MNFFTKHFAWKRKPKLSKLIAVGPQTGEEIDRYYREMIDAKKHLSGCFPTDEEIQAIIADLPKPEAVPHNIYTAEYLPYHLKDTRWMIQYLTNYFESCNLHYDPYTVQKIVAGFQPFWDARNAYKQRLIKAQIQYAIKTEKLNGLMEISPLILRNRPDYDRLFRSEISDGIAKLGIEKKFIEIGLESNADLWRTPTMVRSFVNRYYPRGTQDPQNIMPQHCKWWLKKREYEYYQEHKDSVDNYGLETRNMDLNEMHLGDVNRQIEYYTQLYTEYVRRPSPSQVRRQLANRQLFNSNYHHPQTTQRASDREL